MPSVPRSSIRGIPADIMVPRSSIRGIPEIVFSSILVLM